MVDITSLKARLARLRLGSEFEDKNPDVGRSCNSREEEEETEKGCSRPI